MTKGHNMKRTGNIERMNLARSYKPASGGRIYQKARKSTRNLLEQHAKGSWDALLTQTRGTWDTFAGLALQSYQDAVGLGSMMTKDDLDFINNGGF